MNLLGTENVILPVLNHSYLTIYDYHFDDNKLLKFCVLQKKQEYKGSIF